MKFLLISNMYPTNDSPGYGSFVRNVACGLSSKGIYLSCKSVIYGRSKNKLSKLYKYVLFYISIVLNFLKKVDFIFIHFPNQAIPILSFLFKFHTKKIIVNFHGEDLLYPDTGYAYKLGVATENFCRDYATAIVVPSLYYKNIVVEKNLISSEKIIVSPSGGINPSIFFPTNKRYFSNLNSVINLGYVGRLEEEKGIIEFLESCKSLTAFGISYSATIIGYGSMFDFVQSFIHDNCLENSICIIKGLPQSELGDYYRSFDLLIFCSKASTGESLGLTGIESMACGTPVIGSAIGGIKSYLQDGFNGFLVPTSNVSAIVESVKRYINLPDDEKSKLISNCILTGNKFINNIVIDQLAVDIKSVIG